MKKERDSFPMAVAIDGPAGSGKTTTAGRVARRLGFRHVDTGAMYRAVTWKALETGANLKDAAGIGTIAASVEIEFVDRGGSPAQVFVDGTDVTEAIRSAEVTQNVSLVSSYPLVREAMVRLQRRLAREGNVVLEGRDIGSVVLPSAEVKIFLDASTDERARRRLKELEAKGMRGSLEEVRRDIERRDRFDSSREISPLRIPVGAQIVDTTDLTIEGQVQVVVQKAERVRAAIAAVRRPDGGRHPLKEQAPFYRFVKFCAWVAARFVFGVRVLREDTADYVETYIYAANHRSNADPPVVASVLEREIAFLAKESLFRVPLLGLVIRKLNAIPTARERFDRKAVRTALEWLAGGRSLLMFPEGHRSRTRELGPAKSGIGYLALRSGRPVLPVFISGTEDLWGAFVRRKRLRVVFGRPIRLTDPDGTSVTSEDCDAYGRMVMCGLRALQDEIEPVERGRGNG